MPAPSNAFMIELLRKAKRGNGGERKEMKKLRKKKNTFERLSLFSSEESIKLHTEA